MTGQDETGATTPSGGGGQSQGTMLLSSPLVIGLVAAGAVILGGLGFLIASLIGGDDSDAGGDGNGPPVTTTTLVVETTTTQGVTTTAQETTTTTSGTPEEDSDDPLVLGGGAASVSVPEGWERMFVSDDGNRAGLWHGDQYWIVLDVRDTSDTTGLALVETGVRVWLLEFEGYSQIETSDVSEFNAQEVVEGGILTSFARASFLALYTTNQGSYEVEGNVFGVTRDDGRGLIMVVETPRGEYEEAIDGSLGDIWAQALVSFASD